MSDHLTILTTEGSSTLEEQLTGHRRRRSDVTLVSDSSDSSVATLSFTDDSSDSNTSPPSSRQSRRRAKQRNRKKQKNATSIEDTLTPEEQSRYVALDCEMVGVGYKGKQSALARVTMVDWNHNVILDEYVQPDRDVTNYRTFVSGITPELLEAAQHDLASIRERVLQVMENKIVVGHALKNDMKALHITDHPWYLVRDTAKYEPFMKERFNDGVLWPRGLKELCKNKLQRDIQVEGQPHSPLEDATSALDLYKLARKKWEKAMEYKMNKTKQIEQQQQTKAVQ